MSVRLLLSLRVRSPGTASGNQYRTLVDSNGLSDKSGESLITVFLSVSSTVYFYLNLLFETCTYYNTRRINTDRFVSHVRNLTCDNNFQNPIGVDQSSNVFLLLRDKTPCKNNAHDKRTRRRWTTRNAHEADGNYRKTSRA